MNAKNHIILPLLAAVIALFATRANAEIDSTFKMNELSRSYGLSCEAQAAQRHGNILPPHFSGRPPAFNNESEALVIYSPSLTAAERRTAEQLVASLPPYALPIAWRGGAVYVFVRRSLVEAVPALAYENSWFADYGLYMDVERRLYVPFEKGEDIRRNRGGKLAAHRWAPTQRDQFRVVNHETGHMIDAMLGEYSLDSKGDDGQYRLSNRPDYLAATRADLARLASKNRPISIEKVRKLGYYMPHDFNGVRLGIQTGQRARREVFAELWAEVQGHNSNKVYEAYPDTFKVVKSFADFLKAQDAAAPVRCKLNG